MDEIDYDALQNNEYYLFYEMLIQALKTNDVIAGINSSLDCLKIYLNSGDIILHVKDDANIYTPCLSQTNINHSTNPIAMIVNKTAEITENKGFFKIDFCQTEYFKNIAIIHLRTTDNNYILSINDIDFNILIKPDFFNKLQKTMTIILKRAELYEKNTRAITHDILTGLDNRFSYEQAIQNITEKGAGLVFGIFDLFRLKYINDNYTHEVGDKYIKETAKILKKYWPKERTEILGNGLKITHLTGHCIYRIGGDEFILLTYIDNLELTQIKSKLAAEEVSMIDLEVGNKPIIGLNCGLITHNNGDTLKQTYQNADILMMEDKRKMYIKHNLERRKK